MKSMTGYGSAHYRDEKVDIEVSIRAVNGRFFETRFHIPKEFIAFESDIKKRINKTIKRGNVDIYIQRKYKEKGKVYEIITQETLAKKWVKSAKEMAKKLAIKDSDISFQLLLAHANDVIRIEETPFSLPKIKSILLTTIEQSLKSIDKERLREGGALKRDLVGNLSDLDKLSVSMNKYKTEAGKALQSRYKEKLKALGLKQELDPQRLAQEVVVQVDKLDIQEELIRLKEHIRACKKLLGLNSLKGKKLDFYSQELLREVNTIGSKSQIAKLTEAVVNAKSIIERFREQVQNIE